MGKRERAAHLETVVVGTSCTILRHRSWWREFVHTVRQGAHRRHKRKTKFGIKPAMLDSLEMRLSNRRTMVGRARVAINSDRAVIRRILLSRLSPDQYNTAKGTEAKWAVSGGFNAKDVYIEHSDKPTEYQNDFIQHLNDLVDQFTVVKQNESARDIVVSEEGTEVNVMVFLNPHLLHVRV